MATVAEFKQLFNTFLLENKCPTEEIVKKKYYFPLNQLKTIYTLMLTTNNIQWSQFQLILSKYIENLDFCYYSWECFSTIVQQLNADKTNVYMFTNLLDFVKIPAEKKEDDKLLFHNNNRPQFKYNLQLLKSWVTLVWDGMKPFMVSNAKIRRDMLTLLIGKMLGNLINPLVTADVLMESMDTQGPIGVIGLQGIFILVKDYNLECPNIYGKLYNFFTTDMFHFHYKTRLFYLADIFLHSTHLPEMLVAAFIKRMARLSLIAPPTDIIIMVVFIGNLLIRHPPLRVLIQSDSVVGSDPYIFEEKDPLKSNALNSSLWELLSLKQHILPKVGKSVNFLFKKLPKDEWDLHELLDDSYECICLKCRVEKALYRGSESIRQIMIDEEHKSDIQKVSLTFEKPSSFSVPMSNHMDNLWTLD